MLVRIVPDLLILLMGSLNYGLLMVPWGPGGFKELQGPCTFISTYPDTSATPWCRGMAKNSGGMLFRLQYVIIQVGV